MANRVPLVLASGEVQQAQSGDTLVDPLGNVLASSGPTQAVYVTMSADQTLTTGVITTLNWNTETRDDGGLHDNVTNNSRLTAQVAGWYDIFATIAFASNATGRRLAGLLLNGATEIGRGEIPAGSTGFIALSVKVSYYLNIGDYVVIYGFQTSGGNLNVDHTDSNYGMALLPAFGAPGSGGATQVTVSGTQNGINTNFTLSAAITVGAALVFLNGQLLTSTVDYTISGTSLTFISPTIPVAADTISVFGYTGTAYVIMVGGGGGGDVPFL
jgi:hypothetical protein